MIYIGDINPLMKAIEHVMVDKDINNNDIAIHMNKSKQTVSNLLNCRQKNITLDTLLSLCQSIGCKLEINIIPENTAGSADTTIK